MIIKLLFWLEVDKYKCASEEADLVEGKTCATGPSMNQLSYLKTDQSYILFLVSWQNSPSLFKNSW